jgi:hypothetical protein
MKLERSDPRRHDEDDEREADEARPAGDSREADADKHPDDHAVGPGGT